MTKQTIEEWKNDQRQKLKPEVEKALQERSNNMLTDDQGYCETIWQSVTFRCSYSVCEKHGITDMSLNVFDLDEPMSKSQLAEIMSHALKEVLLKNKKNKCMTSMTFRYWFEEYEDGEDE